MVQVSFAPSFVRQYNKLSTDLQDEVADKIELLKNGANSKTLKIHKLHGGLRNCYGLSINYRIRVIFSFLDKKEVVCLFVGGHDIYE